MTIAVLITEHLRLVILRSLADIAAETAWRRDVLRALAEAPGYAANVSVLHDVLTALGHVLTRDHVSTTVDWLVEQRLCAPAGETVRGVRATQRGLDAARGAAIVTGVAPDTTTDWLAAAARGVCLNVGTDQVEIEAAWLESAGLVRFAREAGRTVLITVAGRDAAAGRRKVAGVKAPSPDSIMAAAARSAAALLRG